MADLLIKGMEMPTSCAKCPCGDDESRYCRVVNNYIPMLGKPSWCPLVEVPPHGRLIDEDLLIADIRENSASYFADDFADEWTSKQPTVIEASEVEHES